MGKNLVLNRFFTQHVLFNIMARRNESDAIYDNAIKKICKESLERNDKELINGDFIREIYRFMAQSYRNEYFYQNTLLNKLLIGKHSPNTTTALTQIPIGKAKADFILINGKAVVYEIKTELDNFDRLGNQIENYYKGFNHVCVVTSEAQFQRAQELLAYTNVGIYVLTKKNTISKKNKKEPTENNDNLDHTTIFKMLHKSEFEAILLEYYGELPQTTQVFYYDRCLEMFSAIPILKAYSFALQQLKKRKRIDVDVLAQIPYELKSLAYFSGVKEVELRRIQSFWSEKYRRE